MTDRPLEIERKFLLRGLPDLAGVPSSAIRQGYVTTPHDTTEVRLRQSGKEFFLSIKGGEGLVRTGREIAISSAQFEALWPETVGRRLEKTRFKGTLAGGLMYDLDLYSGMLEPLMTVEVEFTSEGAANAFAPPDWFGGEVTLDKRYRNKALASADAGTLSVLLGR